ncbi:MAG TPA: GTP cyclohydrolase I [Polyangia bacterium]|jgi:GTP cyclohydrolase I|nr:GTP cyclohydrolase I [Polyangia bacterium]
MSKEAAYAKLEGAYAQILEAFEELGYAVKSDANFDETASRAARGMLELIGATDDVKSQIDTMLSRVFPAQYDEMVISKHNISFGMCPHHLLPVIYRVSVAYLPGAKVLGISKLSRIVNLLAHRPVLQEDLTQELAALLHERMETRGSAAYVEGLHLCMAARGIRAHEARVVTSAVRGVFRENHATRQEFLDLVTAPPLNLL